MSKSIFDITAGDMRSYLTMSSSYCNFELPEYFNFEPIITHTCAVVDSNVSPFKKACDENDVNLDLITNKNGAYDWRPLTLEHPALYANQVALICEEWTTISSKLKKLNESNANNNIICASLPVFDDDNNVVQGGLQWWNEFEQRTLSESILYKNICKADIANCYGSIYTHSIGWAIHGENDARNNGNGNLIGSKLDKSIRYGRRNHTNGIPQGNAVSDLLAELVLADIDRELADIIINSGIDDYKVIRYRDDYNILVEHVEDGRLIVKLLSETLAKRNMKLNNLKVIESSDVIDAAVKHDKLESLFVPQSIYTHLLDGNGNARNNMPAQRRLLQIYQFAKSNPNSGALRRMLANYNLELGANLDGTDTESVATLEVTEVEKRPIIAISLSILECSPLVVKYIFNIIAIMLRDMDESARMATIEEVIKRVNKMPNKDYLQTWLQRITYSYCRNVGEYDAPLAKYVIDRSVSVWNSNWMANAGLNELKDYLSSPEANIVDDNKLQEMSGVMNMGISDFFERY